MEMRTVAVIWRGWNIVWCFLRGWKVEGCSKKLFGFVRESRGLLELSVDFFNVLLDSLLYGKFVLEKNNLFIFERALFTQKCIKMKQFYDSPCKSNLLWGFLASRAHFTNYSVLSVCLEKIRLYEEISWQT